MIYKLYRWSVRDNNSPYTPPESIRRSLVGYRDDDTTMVVTSFVVSVNGREITTKSGSVYILQDIDPNYLQWLNDNKFIYDYNNPIKLK